MKRKRFLLTPLGAILALAIGVAALVGGSGGQPKLAHADASNGTFQFDSATYNVTEGQSAVLTITRTGGSTGTVNVSYTVGAGGDTATGGGVDYGVSGGTVTFNNGEVSKQVAPPISTVNDALVEGPETFTVTITGAAPGLIGGSNNTTVVTIIDNDSPGITVSPTSGLVTSETGTQATFTVVLTTLPTASVTIGLSSNDTTEGTVSPASLTFTTGNWSVPQTVTVTGVDDVLVDGTIAYTIVTAAATSGDGNYNNMNAADVSVSNLDNDGPGQFQFASSTYSVAEGGISITLYVNRINGSTGSVTVDYATSSGSATSGLDFTASAGTLTFGTGVTQQTLSVLITQDALVEGNETFNVTLSNATGGTSIVSPSTSVVTILDDDSGANGQFQFSTTNYPVAETAGTVVVTVNRIGGSSGTASVTYSTVLGGSATAGADYLSTTSTLTFLNGETVKQFTVTIIDDVLAELSETIALQLSAPTGGATLTTPNTATITIIDNETTTGLPVITSVTPATGPSAGNTYVVITGSNFTGANFSGAVTFGGTAATFFTVVNDGTINAYTPAHASGLVQVRVTNGVGTSLDNGTLDDYVYTGTTPVVTSISPSSGSTAGGTSVTIYGSAFTGTTSVTFGGVSAAFTVNSDGSITATSPAHTAGTVDIVVTNASGPNSNTTADDFTYTSTGSHTTYTLSFRWNLLVWFGADGASAESALKGYESPDDSLTNNIFTIATAMFKWSASSQLWQAFYPSAVGVPGGNDFTTLSRYTAYWVAVTTSTSWTIGTP